MKTRIVLILITLLCAAIANVQSARAATIMVTNTTDSGPGSLRQALADANDGDIIDATGVSGTILLTSGELQILRGVTIKGPGAGTLAVNGNGSSVVFENFGGGVTISGFTITNDGGGGLLNTVFGGLTVSNCTISGNSADYIGGISNGGSLTISNSTISGNSANYGGGISNSGSLTISNSTISGNSANYGGGISNYFSLAISNSTISGNSADYGGGISNVGGGVTISNSTLSGNVASFVGGGAHNSPNYSEFRGALLSVTNSTISGNSAPGKGGGIFNNGCAGYVRCAYLTLGSTILNAGASGGTIFNYGRVMSLGYNLASDAGGDVLTGPGDQINTDPLLGPLQDNGGPTFTQALLPGSPAINAGDTSFTPPPYYDQRGCPFGRVFNGRIDVGSLEAQPPPLRPCMTPRPRPTPAPRPTL